MLASYNLAQSMLVSSAGDRSEFYIKKKGGIKLSLQYLDLAWKVHSNEYKQA